MSDPSLFLWLVPSRSFAPPLLQAPRPAPRAPLGHTTAPQVARGETETESETGVSVIREIVIERRDEMRERERECEIESEKARAKQSTITTVLPIRHVTTDKSRYLWRPSRTRLFIARHVTLECASSYTSG